MYEDTVKAELVGKQEDSMGYIKYVFKAIHACYFEYILCTRFPNWGSPPIEINDKGYLTYRKVRAGKDEWFNGEDFIPYRYTGTHFLSFVPELENKDYEYHL